MCTSMKTYRKIGMDNEWKCEVHGKAMPLLMNILLNGNSWNSLLLCIE